MKLYHALRTFIHERFSLDKSKEESTEVIDAISRNIYFRGTNLWILMFAIIIASVGLNVNSTAVIIGAMLISPLMGPIMGIGLGAGINDFLLIRKSAFNFLVAILISLLTSALYFLLSPLDEAHSELLARTTPTVYDVFIALFGGLAGIVATSTKEKGNVIPGVAIATALMPPLCTAGYGIAIGNLFYIAGALYLFFINSVFICLATFLMVRFLRFPQHSYPDLKTGRRMRRWIWFIVTVTFLPSVVIAYFMINKSVFERNAERFIEAEMNFSGNTIIQKSVDKSNRTISLVYIGKGVSSDQVGAARKKLENYSLSNVNLKVEQRIKELSASDIVNMKTQIVDELFQKNQDVIESKDDLIQKLEAELAKYRTASAGGTMARELQALYPAIREFSISRTLLNQTGKKTADTINLVLLSFSKRMAPSDITRIKAWFEARMPGEKVKIVVEK